MCLAVVRLGWATGVSRLLSGVGCDLDVNRAFFSRCPGVFIGRLCDSCASFSRPCRTSGCAASQVWQFHSGMGTVASRAVFSGALSVLGVRVAGIGVWQGRHFWGLARELWGSLARVEVGWRLGRGVGR